MRFGVDVDDDLCYSIRWIKMTTKKKEKENGNAFECQPPRLRIFNELSLLLLISGTRAQPKISYVNEKGSENKHSSFHQLRFWKFLLIIWFLHSYKMGRHFDRLSFLSFFHFLHHSLDSILGAELCQHSVLVVLTARNCTTKDRSIHFMRSQFLDVLDIQIH